MSSVFTVSSMHTKYSSEAHSKDGMGLHEPKRGVYVIVGNIPAHPAVSVFLRAEID